MAEMVTATFPFSTTGATGMSTCCCAPAGSCRTEIIGSSAFCYHHTVVTEYIRQVTKTVPCMGQQHFSKFLYMLLERVQDLPERNILSA